MPPPRAILAKSMIIREARRIFRKRGSANRGNGFYESTPVSETTPENLIVIMNESPADMRVIRDFQMNQEYFPFISSLTDNNSSGAICMCRCLVEEPVILSMRSWTGHSMALLPYVISAHSAYCRPEEYGMASTLKAQGYTTVAMHPNISKLESEKCISVYGI